MSDNIWKDLAAPLPKDRIEWRIDGKPKQRDGKYFARFVCYIDAHFVRERLDQAADGDWLTRLDPLPAYDVVDFKSGVTTDRLHVFKCTLTIKGVSRDDVGEGDTPKTAATDAFKRAAVRFGIGAELYSMGQNWVEVDGDGKYAKAVEDPQAAYERKRGAPAIAKNLGITPRVTAPAIRTDGLTDADKADARAAMGLDKPAPAGDALACPTCSGAMWDNRPKKESGAFKPNAPDWSCKDKACGGKWWKDADGRKEPVAVAASGPLVEEEDDLPF